MQFQLKNVKYAPFLSEETNAFTADLWVEGLTSVGKYKKAGNVKNDGRGGETMVTIHLLTADERTQIKDWIKAQPDKVYPAGGGSEEFTLPMSLDIIADDLFGEWFDSRYGKIAEEKKWIKRAVVFRLKDAPAGEYRTFKLAKGQVYSKKHKELIQKKYGDQVAEIINEKYGQVP